MKIKRCLIIEWAKLPQELKDSITEYYNFSNDIILPYHSEFSMKDFAKGMAAVEEYWNDQKESNGFEGDLKAFIEDYGLELDIWLMKKKNIDWTQVDKILIEVSW